MTSWSYIAESLPWAIAGLLAGYFMARSTVAVATIAAAAKEEIPVADQPSRRPRFSATHVIGVVVALLGIFTAVQSYVQGEATERLAVCTQAYSNGFADAIEERSKASADAQNALDDFITAVAKATPTEAGRDQVRKAFDDYLSKRATAKKAQAENPYPAPPRDVCR